MTKKTLVPNVVLLDRTYKLSYPCLFQSTLKVGLIIQKACQII